MEHHLKSKKCLSKRNALMLKSTQISPRQSDGQVVTPKADEQVMRKPQSYFQTKRYSSCIQLVTVEPHQKSTTLGPGKA